MSIEAATVEEPPSYDEPDVWQPVILVLAGQSIHAETTDSAPLYRLNRGVASLTHAMAEVELESVRHIVRTGPLQSDNGPERDTRTRVRHIYTLRHIQSVGPVVLPSDAPRFYIEAISRRREALGDIGLKKARFRSSRWTALPVNVSGNSTGFPQFTKDGEPVFEIRRQKDGKHQWTDGSGSALAVEDEGEGQHRLVVTASLSRETMDALVALWCCRLWEYSAEHAERVRECMEGVRRRFSLSKELPGGSSTSSFWSWKV